MKKQNIQLGRMAACLMVFGVHFSQRMYLGGVFSQLGNIGAYGVQLFFIISGYLIANSSDTYARENIGCYIVRRMVKLLPLYYFVITYYFLMHTFVFRDVPVDITGFGWLRYFLLLNRIVPITGTYFWDNLGITWTIPYFVCAYLCLPILLKAVKNFWASLLCCVGMWFFTSRILWRLTAWLDVLYNIHYFFMGIVAFYSIKENKKVLITGILSVLLAYIGITGPDWSMIASFLFVLLIIWTDTFHSEHPTLKKILQISDRYSYTMYLAHGIVFVHVMDRYDMGILRPFVAIFGTVLATVVINRWIETPVQYFLITKLEPLNQKK